MYVSTLKTARDLPIFASYHALLCISYCFSHLIGPFSVTWLSLLYKFTRFFNSFVSLGSFAFNNRLQRYCAVDLNVAAFLHSFHESDFDSEFFCVRRHNTAKILVFKSEFMPRAQECLKFILANTDQQPDVYTPTRPTDIITAILHVGYLGTGFFFPLRSKCQSFVILRIYQGHPKLRNFEPLSSH